MYSLIYFTYKLRLRQKEREIEFLKKADLMKDEFLTQMSHEIRTPLNSILSFSRYIKDEVENKTGSELTNCFESIENSGRRIIRTIEQILNMSELKTGLYRINKKEINLFTDILIKIIDEIRHEIERKGLTLIVKNSEIPNLIFDENSYNMIFVNLVENAVKFTKEGFIKIETGITDSNEVFVEISDSGIGISSEYIPFLYSPFSQQERGYARKFDGNGLGLALVKKYCEINQASITVNTEVGKGSSLEVPLKSKKQK